MAQRDSATASHTSEFLQLLSVAVFNLDTSTEVWEELIRQAKEDLNTLTREAALSLGDTGLHSASYQTRAQELVIRLEILEEFVAQIHKTSNLVET